MFCPFKFYKFKRLIWGGTGKRSSAFLEGFMFNAFLGKEWMVNQDIYIYIKTMSLFQHFYFWVIHLNILICANAWFLFLFRRELFSSSEISRSLRYHSVLHVIHHSCFVEKYKTRAPQWENYFNTFSAYNSQYIMIFWILQHFGGT